MMIADLIDGFSFVVNNCNSWVGEEAFLGHVMKPHFEMILENSFNTSHHDEG
jgi:hypothetical protein